MKKLAAYLLSPLLYVCGHWCSTLLHYKCMAFLYRPYQWCMLSSCDIEEWAGVEVMWKVL